MHTAEANLRMTCVKMLNQQSECARDVGILGPDGTTIDSARLLRGITCICVEHVHTLRHIHMYMLQSKTKFKI